MTEGVTTAAAVPGAVHGPAGGRHGRRDEHAAGAFDEVLGAPKTPHRAEASAGAKTRADPWRQARTRLGTGAPALTAAIAKDGHAAKNTLDAKPERGVAESLDQADDTADDEADPAETGADDGLPTQMRRAGDLGDHDDRAHGAPVPPIGHGHRRTARQQPMPSSPHPRVESGPRHGRKARPGAAITYPRAVPGGLLQPARTPPQPAASDVPPSPLPHQTSDEGQVPPRRWSQSRQLRHAKPADPRIRQRRTGRSGSAAPAAAAATPMLCGGWTAAMPHANSGAASRFRRWPGAVIAGQAARAGRAALAPMLRRSSTRSAANRAGAQRRICRPRCPLTAKIARSLCANSRSSCILWSWVW